MKIIIILFVLLFTVLLAFIQGLQAKDRKANSLRTDVKLKKNWHIAQGGLHILIAIAVFLISLPDWFSACFGFFMTLSIIWLVFDIVNNKITGNKAFYHGDSSFLDRFLNKFPVPVEILIKGILLIISITYFFKNPYKL